MGYMRHHAILVTGGPAKEFEDVYKKASECGFVPGQLSAIAPAVMNGHQSFAVFPDGSKEGWADSDAGDKARETFIKYLRARQPGAGGCWVDWVEVQYGDDECMTAIVGHSDEREAEYNEDEGHSFRM